MLGDDRSGRDAGEEVGRNMEIRELTGDEDFRCKEEKRNRSEST